MSKELTKVICIAGPTATGKTAAAVELAWRLQRQLNLAVEIISVDSALVYRHMNIGTAKPSSTEMQGIKHHLIDIIEPNQSYSVADFVKTSNSLVAEIQARQAIPLLVGGTMLYFNSWFYGLAAIPSANQQISQQIFQQAQQQGWPAMHAKLAQVDGVTAAKLSVNDQQRIQRALEVFYNTGKPISSFHSPAEQTKLAAEYVLFALEPADRAWLHQRVEQRFDMMLEQGLLSEVKQLMARGDLTPAMPSMRCVGYRQAWAYLAGEITAEEFNLQAKAASRQLVKRQLTWLRKMSQRKIIVCDQVNVVPSIWQQLIVELT